MKIHLATAVKMWLYDLGGKKYKELSSGSSWWNKCCQGMFSKPQLLRNGFTSWFSSPSSASWKSSRESHVCWVIYTWYIHIHKVNSLCSKKYELPLFFVDCCLHQGPVREWKLYQSLNRQNLSIRNFQLGIKLWIK